MSTKVANIAVDSATGKVTWDALSGATHYLVKYKQGSDETFTVVTSPTATKADLANKDDKVWVVSVAAFKSNGATTGLDANSLKALNPVYQDFDYTAPSA